MDRLLNESDIKKIRLLPENEDNTYSEMMIVVAQAQLTKTDQEWIDWIEKGTGLAITQTEWRNRKKEIGLLW